MKLDWSYDHKAELMLMPHTQLRLHRQRVGGTPITN